MFLLMGVLVGLILFVVVGLVILVFWFDLIC